jgi:hypothetical protein
LKAFGTFALMPFRALMLTLGLSFIAGCGGGSSQDQSGVGTSDTPGGTTSGGSGGGANSGGGIRLIVTPDGGDNAGGAGPTTQCDSLRIATIGRIGPWGTSTLFSAWLQKEGTQPAVDLGDAVLTAETLDKFDVIVALNLAQFPIREGKTQDPGVSHSYSAAEASALETWVRRGGGIMTTIGYTSNEAEEQVNIDNLLAFSKMGYSTTLLDADGDVTRFDPHPTTTNVLKLAIQNGVRPAGTGGTVIGWDSSNREALLAGTVENGKIVVWGDEWITYDAYWGSRPDLNIERFWVNVMNWLAPQKACMLPDLVK